jgi:hypothetical protein
MTQTGAPAPIITALRKDYSITSSAVASMGGGGGRTNK